MLIKVIVALAIFRLSVSSLLSTFSCNHLVKPEYLPLAFEILYNSLKITGLEFLFKLIFNKLQAKYTKKIKF